jgi:hypothetical protein
MQTAPTPTMWARPVLAPGCWRWPASPRSWVVISQTCPTPVGPMGCPIASRPPEALTATRPPIVELARFEVGRGAAGRTYAHGFDVEELLDRERVVQLDDVEVSGGDAGLAEGLRGGLAGERSVEVLAVVHALGSRYGREHPHGPVAASPRRSMASSEATRTAAAPSLIGQH